jgi:protein-S-isoprenylcysteine O-methyltransferase Ste14
MEHFLRYFLPAYLIVYVIAAFVWRSFFVWKQTGLNPVVFGSSDDAHSFVGRVFKLTFALIVVAVLIYSFLPAVHPYLLPIWWLEFQWLKLIGLGLLLLSLTWIVLAQSQMGTSWRIGIDNENRTALVQKGVFRISRNPIFVGMVMTLLGFFVVIPNVLSLLALVMGVTLIGIQVRLEEEYLARMHGDDYVRYCRSVRRWL